MSEGTADSHRVYVGAYALCVEATHLLLARIAANEADARRWTLPGGGLHWGESPELGVLRELEEETGLLGTVTGVAGIFSDVYGQSVSGPGSPVHHIGILYTVSHPPGPLRFETGGSTDLCEWVSRDKIHGLDLVPLAKFGFGLAFGMESARIRNLGSLRGSAFDS